MRRKIATTMVAATAALVYVLPNASNGVSAATSTTPFLRAAVPAGVRSGQAQPTGRLGASTRLPFIVTLKIRDWEKLSSTLLAESTPGSARFGHYLTQNQANRLFNPTATQQQQVSTWLQSNGISVTHTFVNHLMVDASGTVGAIQKTFHLSLLRYRGTLYGKVAHFFAPSTSPAIPASLSGIVNGVTGLDNTTRLIDTGVIRSHRLRPDGSSSLEGYYPSDYRTAYDVPKTETGQGEYIGITLFDDPPSNTSLTAWAKKVGLGAFEAPTTTSKRLSVRKVDGGVTDGDSAESAIDIENSYGMAPGATVVYWEFNDQTQSPDGAMDALNDAGTTGPSAQGFNGKPIEYQISSSWGLCEDSSDDASNENPVLASDSATGHNFFFSSGDTGSYCPESSNAVKDDPYPQYPADSQYVTSVGGTAFSKGSKKFAPLTLKSYPGEMSWYYGAKANKDSDQCWSTSKPCPEGSSGGYSNVYARPSWQVAPGLAAGSGACPETKGVHICRAFPDVSAAGDPDYSGSVVCYSQGCEVDGGTSLASPLWAGMEADMNSYLATSQFVLGFADPAFYSIAGQATYTSDFHDIVCPNAVTQADGGCSNGKYSTGVGWDAVTGLGSPNVAKLQADLLNAAKSG